MSVSEFLGNSGYAAWAQVAASVLLVGVTLWYVRLTRRLVEESQNTAHRQAILQARSDFSASLARSVDALGGCLAVADLLGSEESPDEGDAKCFDPLHLKPVMLALEGFVRRDDADFTLFYIDDFVGPFPLSDSLVLELTEAGRTAYSDMAALARAVGVASHYPFNTAAAKETRDIARTLEQSASELARRVIDLRTAVRSSGYARGFGDLALDSPDIPGKLEHIVVRDGKWVLQSDERQ